MTKEEATKSLQQLYANSGHCWLDEQRIEAIGMAVKALQEEPVSEDLEEEVIKKVLYFSENFHKAPWAIDSTGAVMPIWYAKFGAKWQRENLWKPADSDDLPEIDREVIVFTQPYPLEGNDYAVSFAHRPNPDGWNGKSLTSGKVEHYTPKTYGKGGWNIPNIVYWLDVDLPKEIEL